MKQLLLFIGLSTSGMNAMKDHFNRHLNSENKYSHYDDCLDSFLAGCERCRQSFGTNSEKNRHIARAHVSKYWKRAQKKRRISALPIDNQAHSE